MIFRWTSKCDNRRATSISSSLKRDEIAQVGWLTGGENFVSKRNQFILYQFLASEEIQEQE